jgi:hypothetical protein
MLKIKLYIFLIFRMKDYNTYKNFPIYKMNKPMYKL